MGECIAMAVGFVLGAGCVLVTIAGTGKIHPRHPGKETEERAGNPPTAEAVPPPLGKEGLLQKQWENFLNYEGSGNGQMPIGDE